METSDENSERGHPSCARRACENFINQFLPYAVWLRDSDVIQWSNWIHNFYSIFMFVGHNRPSWDWVRKDRCICTSNATGILNVLSISYCSVKNFDLILSTFSELAWKSSKAIWSCFNANKRAGFSNWRAIRISRKVYWCKMCCACRWD